VFEVKKRHEETFPHLAILAKGVQKVSILYTEGGEVWKFSSFREIDEVTRWF